MDYQQELENVTRQLIDKYKPSKLMLFGSGAQGINRVGSDIDFLIIKEQVPYYGVDRIRELDRLIEYNIPVDFIVYTPQEFDERLRMGDPFLKTVCAKSKVLYG